MDRLNNQLTKMTKTILFAFLLSVASLSAQYAPSGSFSSTAAAEINSKPAYQTGTGAPSALNCAIGKDFYTDVATGYLYDCTVTGTPGTWARASVHPPLVSADIVNNAANTSGLAGTATALAATPTLCSTGQAPTGILASGNATGCATVSGGSGSSAPMMFKVLCQGTLSGSPYNEPTTNGASHGCDSAWSGSLGDETFANGSINYAILGPFVLSSSFADPVKLNAWFNSSSTSGSFQPSVAALCVASGGAITTNWWITPTGGYTNFTSTATNATAGVQTAIPQLSYTSGCTTGQMYLSIRATSSATPTLGANLTVLSVAGIQ